MNDKEKNKQNKDEFEILRTISKKPDISQKKIIKRIGL